MVARRSGDFFAAEDATQEALIIAARRWAVAGVPDHPLGWLVQTAMHKLVDAKRSELARQGRELRAVRSDRSVVSAPAEDDSLAVLIMCCHPSLTPASAIALTLRAVGGLTTAEIAAAFLVPEPTMAQRITRAKQRLASAGAPFSLPEDADLPARIAAVLRVLYLIFNAGHDLVRDVGARRDLTQEAIRLTRMLAALRPDDPEVGGLLALMLLTDARRGGRVDSDGALVPLAEQDRSRWDAQEIAEGVAVLDLALTHGTVGEYQIQAAIAALHDRAQSAEATDWPQIHALYGLLHRMTDSPVVAINLAVAAGMALGPEAGLEVLESTAEPTAAPHRYAAVRGHLLERAGRLDEAISCFIEAARVTPSRPERDHLIAQAARLRSRS